MSLHNLVNAPRIKMSIPRTTSIAHTPPSQPIKYHDFLNSNVRAGALSPRKAPSAKIQGSGSPLSRVQQRTLQTGLVYEENDIAHEHRGLSPRSVNGPNKVAFYPPCLPLLGEAERESSVCRWRYCASKRTGD